MSDLIKQTRTAEAYQKKLGAKKLKQEKRDFEYAKDNYYEIYVCSQLNNFKCPTCKVIPNYRRDEFGKMKLECPNCHSTWESECFDTEKFYTNSIFSFALATGAFLTFFGLLTIIFSLFTERSIIFVIPFIIGICILCPCIIKIVKFELKKAKVYNAEITRIGKKEFIETYKKI